ncbi:hypothetical protein HAX54_016382 [Datura stramonium]|uniref:TCP domain-containing protein n=1 Tax=Datura stramonium TaxID=4076 RepID=A0ABS8RZY9_DATST|nr:hypothetical protein [Datura stramonium]
MNSRSKQETGGDDHTNNSTKIFSRTTTPSRQSWAGFKNPRIVRVSRTFGGKDRHSKVCTVKGLRDRRIRLSVPTAIQLYDLQDRLGLSQPSKVVDWLIDATKHDIDKLPPLQMPPPSLSHLFNMKDHHRHQDFVDDATLRSSETGFGKEKWIAPNEQENDTNINIIGAAGCTSVPLLSSQSSTNFFQSSNLPAGGMLNSNMPFNWEPNSNLSLGPFGNYHSAFSSSQTDHHHSQEPSNIMSFPSSGSQLYFCPTAATTLSSLLVPPIYNSSHLHHFHPNSLVQTLQLISTPLKSSFTLNDNNPKGLNLQERDDHKEASGS